MCLDPVSAAVLTFGMGAAQSIAGYSAEKQNAKNARKAARAAYVNDTNRLTLRQVQEADAESQKLTLQNVDEAKRRAEVEVSAAEANVAGISVDNILADVSRNAANNRETIRSNTKMVVEQIQQEKRGAANTAKSRMNAVPEPSPLSLVAGIGSSALNGFSTYDKMMNPS